MSAVRIYLPTLNLEVPVSSLGSIFFFFYNPFPFNSFLSLMGDWINSVVDFCDTKAADKSMMHSSYVVLKSLTICFLTGMPHLAKLQEPKLKNTIR